MANKAPDATGAVSVSVSIQCQQAVHLQCVSGRLPHYLKSIKNLQQSVSSISGQCQRAKSARSYPLKLMPAISLEQRRAKNLGEDLAENMLSLDDLGELSPDDCSARKRILIEIEHMAQQIDALSGRLGSMKGDAVEKLSNQAARVLASHPCKQLALSIGIVLEAILVYLPPRQHFSAAIALTQSGGAKPDIAAIRMSQVPQPLPKVDSDGLQGTGQMRGMVVDWLLKVNTMHSFQPENLYAALSLMDRYLSQRSVSQSRLQLVGLAAVSIVGKFEGITPPNAIDIVDQYIINKRTSINCQQQKRHAKENKYPPPPSRPHGGKLQRRAGILAQPGGRQRGKDRGAKRV